MSEQVGVIGVGRMGSGIATNLLERGEEVTVFDIDRASVAELEEAGATGVESVGTLVEEVDVVFTSLPTNESVEAVYLGDDGVLASASDGVALVELSTISPETVEGIAASIDERGLDVDLVDAPVFGGPESAASGELTVVVGAEDGAFERVSPLLAAFSTETFHVGPVGEAKRVKLVRNAVNYGNWAVASELFAFAKHLGVGPEELYEVTSSDGPLSSILGSRFPRVVEEDFDPGFPVDGAMKDLEYALDLDEDDEYGLALTEAVLDRYRYAAEEEDPESDYAVLMSALEK